MCTLGWYELVQTGCLPARRRDPSVVLFPGPGAYVASAPMEGSEQARETGTFTRESVWWRGPSGGAPGSPELGKVSAQLLPGLVH